LIALVAVIVVGELARQHPGVTAVVLLVMATPGGVWGVRAAVRRRRRALRERDASVAEVMSDPQFTRYVARLLRAGGHRRLRVFLGLGDMGADIVAVDAHGRRWAVHCVRDTGRLTVADVRRSAATARRLHRADVAMLVTAGQPSAALCETAHRCRILLVDRPALTRWAATRALPTTAFRGHTPDVSPAGRTAVGPPRFSPRRDRQAGRCTRRPAGSDTGERAAHPPGPRMSPYRPKPIRGYAGTGAR
jgi:restriction system protein